MPALSTPALTPALRRLLVADAEDRRAAGSLPTADIETLVAAALRDDAPALAPHRAIRLLAAAADAAVAIPVLERVARDPGAALTNRIAAVRGLGTVATADAQAVLLPYAVDADARLQQAALAALGLFADRSALEALADVPEPADPALRRQLAFTRALLAHRAGLAGVHVPDTQGIRRPADPTGHTAEVELALKTAEATLADRARLGGSTYGIRLAERAYALRCGRAQWTVFGNRGLGPVLGADRRLFERPWIAALLARWMPPGVAVVTQYVLLSSPVECSVRLQVMRSDGETVYAGWGEARGPGLYFEISDVDRPQTAPTLLAGVLEPDGVRLEAAVLASTRVALRRTQPVEAG